MAYRSRAVFLASARKLGKNKWQGSFLLFCRQGELHEKEAKEALLPLAVQALGWERAPFSPR